MTVFKKNVFEKTPTLNGRHTVNTVKEHGYIDINTPYACMMHVSFNDSNDVSVHLSMRDKSFTIHSNKGDFTTLLNVARHIMRVSMGDNGSMRVGTWLLIYGETSLLQSYKLDYEKTAVYISDSGYPHYQVTLED